MNKSLMPKPNKPRDRKLSDQVYERILEKIVNGIFPEQSKLPTELDLSRELQVSRPVLRQALSQLRQDQVIASRQGSGSYVLRRPDPQVLDFAPVGTIADIQRCYEFRAAVESEGAALAAERRTEDQLVKIEEALHVLEDAIANKELGVEADERFHAAISEATENLFFQSARNSMLSQIQFGIRLTRNLSLTKTNERLFMVQAEHEAVYEAIRDKNPARAREAMLAHINKARLRVFEG